MADSSIAENYQEKKIRYFGAPSEKNRLNERDKLDKRVDEATQKLRDELRRKCREVMEPTSFLEYLEKHNGKVSFRDTSEYRQWVDRFGHGLTEEELTRAEDDADYRGCIEKLYKAGIFRYGRKG